jgi:hypothetical protein
VYHYRERALINNAMFGIFFSLVVVSNESFLRPSLNDSTIFIN